MDRHSPASLSVPYAALIWIGVVAAALLLLSTSLVPVEELQWAALGACFASLGAAVLQFVVTKAVMWPDAVIFRRPAPIDPREIQAGGRPRRVPFVAWWSRAGPYIMPL